jgi:hypothetical protein
MRRQGPWRVEDFELHRQVYKGKASLLYRATCRLSGLPVALKLYRKARLSTLNWFQVRAVAFLSPHTAACRQSPACLCHQMQHARQLTGQQFLRSCVPCSLTEEGALAVAPGAAGDPDPRAVAARAHHPAVRRV